MRGNDPMSRELSWLVPVAQVLVAVWLTVLVFRSLRSLSRGDRRSILFVEIVYYFFFGLPVVLDLTLGAPVFTYQRGFAMAQADAATNLIYLGYIAAVPLVFRRMGGPPRFHEPPMRVAALSRWLQVFAWASLLSLPFVLTLAPDPSEYAQYAVYVGKGGGVYRSYQNVVTFAATLAVISGVLLLTAPNTLAPVRIAVLPFLALGVWLHGKRSIVALAVLLTLYLLWTRGVLRGRRFLVAIIASATALGVFSAAYQSKLRRLEDTPVTRDTRLGASPAYLNFRIDYGRDAITRQTIFAELHPDQLHILDYRMQSIVFDLTFFVPRKMWPGKPYPYAVYATAAMFDMPARDLGWGTTTSWLEEAIANLGWFGLLVGPLLPALVCRIGDRHRTPFAGLLTVSVASLLLILQIVAFLPFIALWLVTVVRRSRAPVVEPGGSAPPLTGLARRRR